MLAACSHTHTTYKFSLSLSLYFPLFLITLDYNENFTKLSFFCAKLEMKF